MRSASRACVGSIVGAERVRASVSAELDFTETEQTRESFDPNVQMVRSEQTSEDTRRGEGMQGVPGALEQSAAGGRGAAGRRQRSDGRDGRSRQLLAVVDAQLRARQDREPHASGDRLDPPVVDRRARRQQAAGDSANGAPTPLTEQEIASLTDIVRQAVGFDEARGDTISVVNSAFQQAAAAAQPAAPAFWENPTLWSIARQVLGAALVLALA